MEKNPRRQSYTCAKVIRKTYSDEHVLASEKDRKQLCWYCKCHCPGAPIHRCTRKKSEKIIEATLLQSKLATVSKTCQYYVISVELKDGVEKRCERRGHMEFYLRIYSITWLKVKRLKKLKGSPTKAKQPSTPRYHSLRDEVTKFMSMLPREPCHFALASHSLYLTTVDSVFDIFKAWLLNKEPGVFEAMQAASYWGYSLSGEWGDRAGEEPKAQCSYDYTRASFLKFRDGPDKYKFAPRHADQCATCNKKADKIRVL